MRRNEDLVVALIPLGLWVQGSCEGILQSPGNEVQGPEEATRCFREGTKEHPEQTIYGYCEEAKKREEAKKHERRVQNEV